MTSPMKRPGLHDTFVLLDGAKRRPIPGVARVTVSLGANQDVQAPPAGQTKVTNLNEATADISVSVVMWTAEQWEAYQSLLQVFRASKTIFTSTHPELRARRVKRLYFVSEQGEPYDPAVGYRISLKFSEKLKTPAAAPSGVGDPNSLDAPLGVTSQAPTTAAVTATGAKLRDAAIQTGVQNPPPKTLDGVHDISDPGYCAASQRVAWAAAGLDTSLFAGTAKATEAKFKAAGQSLPWSSVSQTGLQVGDLIFYGNDKSGLGHVGTYIGQRPDGTAMVVGNNGLTYDAQKGKYDAAGRPTGYNAAGQKIDSRGVQPLLSLGTPTSIGRATKVGAAVAGPAFQAPTPTKPAPGKSTNVPLPPNRPSLTPPRPPAAAFTPGAPRTIFPTTPAKPIFPG